MLSRFSRVHLLVTPWAVAHQAPLYWHGLPFSPPGDLPQPRDRIHLLLWQAGSFLQSHQGSLRWNLQCIYLLSHLSPIMDMSGWGFCLYSGKQHNWVAITSYGEFQSLVTAFKSSWFWSYKPFWKWPIALFSQCPLFKRNFYCKSYIF